MNETLFLPYRNNIFDDWSMNIKTKNNYYIFTFYNNISYQPAEHLHVPEIELHDDTAKQQLFS